MMMRKREKIVKIARAEGFNSVLAFETLYMTNLSSVLNL